MSEQPQIIGLTGSFGSGCSYIAENVFAPMGYKWIKLSELLRKMHADEGRSEPREVKKRKRALQEFGDIKRREQGSGVFAQKAIEEIKSSEDEKWIVDSIRNPAEVEALREHSQNFFLFGIAAERTKRWDRVKDKFEGDWKQFEDDDHNDKGDDNPSHGQRVGACFNEADIVIGNEKDFSTVGNAEFQDLRDQIQRYLDLISDPRKGDQPKENEVIMAMAYALSQRSSCLQRKVGAIIVDDENNMISSGYNEVPKPEKFCREEYKECFRKHKRNEFFSALESNKIIAPENRAAFETLFKDNFKILDLCRAMHAEENAIINLVRNSVAVNLEKCTLYTTTHPCRLCANKISRVKLKSVVYLEPYPDPEAVRILERNNIPRQFFQGVTFRAFFRLYGFKED